MPRNVGIPLSADMPAPVSQRTRPCGRSRSCFTESSSTKRSVGAECRGRQRHGPYRGAEKSARGGCVERLGLQMWSEALEALDHASLAWARAPIRGGCCLADCHLGRRLHPPSRLCAAPLHTETFEPRPAARRHQAKCTTPPQDSKREPAGRSPAPEAPPRQSEAIAAEGGLRVGVGGRCKQTTPGPPTQDRPPPHARQQPYVNATAPVKRQKAGSFEPAFHL